MPEFPDVEKGNGLMPIKNKTFKSSSGNNVIAEVYAVSEDMEYEKMITLEI
jgi:hypothetical protein